MVIDKRICEDTGALRGRGSARVGLCEGGGSARAGLCEGGVLQRRGLVVFCCGHLHTRGGRWRQRRGRFVIG